MIKKKHNKYILYDYLMEHGGAESVFYAMVHALGSEAKGVVGYSTRKYETFNSVERSIDFLSSKNNASSFLSHFIIPLKFRFFFPEDKVMQALFSGLYALLSSSNFHEDCLKIYYCHTPPRHWYDLKDYYKKNSTLLIKLALSLQRFLFKASYESCCAKQHLIIANSVNVKKRIKKYLGLDSIVVYPPCNTSKYQWKCEGDYYLSTARLEPYKRVDLIVEAFKEMPNKKLVVASGGSQQKHLEKLAEHCDNISFTGWCDEQELISLVGGCIATIYLPISEDFGISPVESMAAGKPVIGVSDGGVKETVIAGVTGILCPKNVSKKDIIKAVRTICLKTALTMRYDCEERSKLFSDTKFEESMKKLSGATLSSLESISKEIDAQ